MKCPRCGGILPEGMLFCGYCGCRIVIPHVSDIENETVEEVAEDEVKEAAEESEKEAGQAVDVVEVPASIVEKEYLLKYINYVKKRGYTR